MNQAWCLRPALRRGLAGIGVALVITAADTGRASGQGDGPAVRVRGSAMATGARFVFSRPGSAPVEPPVDARFGAAGGSLDQVSDTAFGFASSFYPGDVPATPGSVLPLLGFPIGGQIFPAEHPIRQSYDSLPGLIPPWPMVTQGSYPGDPGRRVDLLQDVTGTIPAPLPTSFSGMTQETTVDRNLVVAETTIDTMTMTGLTGLNPEFEPLAEQLDALTEPYAGGRPGVKGNSVSVRGLNSTYKIVNEGFRATSTSEIVVREIDVAGGLLQLFRVRSFASHEGTAGGVKVLAHGTEVGLARVLGMEVTFDDRGAVLTDRRVPPDQREAVQKAIDDVLAQTPFSVEATRAQLDGTRVIETAFRLVMEGQEPSPPGVSPIGRYTRITLDFGSLDADLAVVAAPSEAPAGTVAPVSASETEGGSPSGVASTDPGAGLGSGLPVSDVAAGSGRPTRQGRAEGGADRRSRSELAVPLPSRGVGPGSGPYPSPGAAGIPAGAELAAPALVASGPTRSGDQEAGPARGERLVLLPGVVANAAEHREITGQLQRSARSLVMLAGLGAGAVLLTGRSRRTGVLR